MKLFTDMSTEIHGEVELNESSSEKTYVIKGIFSSPGIKNRNGRVYPIHLWEENVRRYQDEIKNNTVNTLAELEHPARSTVNPWEAVAKTRLLELRDGKIYGEMEILNNNDTKTNQLKALIEAGVSIGVSTRGVGRLGKGQLVEEYQLITTDIVSNPSDYGANLQGFSESMILESEEFSINEGKIICTPDGCSLEEDSKEETLCSKKAKELLNIFENISKEHKELSENEIKAFNIIAMCEKGLTYSELLDKISDIEVELKKYKKDSDEYDVLNFELQGYKEQVSRVKPKKIAKIKESEELVEGAYSDAQKSIGDVFKKFKYLEEKVSREEWNKLRTLIHEAEKNLAKASDFGRELGVKYNISERE